METPISVTEASQVAQARRHVLSIAKMQGLSEELAGKAALVVTEAATNLVKYGQGGYIVARPCVDAEQPGLEIMALDCGPGMARIEHSMGDGYSTGGSLGLGLGTISRASSYFEVYTLEQHGTAILSRLHEPDRRAAASGSQRQVSLSGFSTAKAGQEVCGDAWAYRWADGALWVMAADGLGHGPFAATASAEAVRVFHAAGGNDTPYDVLRAAHAALKSTRGAVMAVAAIRPRLGSLQFAGIGNISAGLVDGAGLHRMGCTDGTVGYSIRTVREQSYSWEPGCMLILTTDGLSSRWGLAQHPALAARHPSLIAGVLHRDFARSNDDATVVVVKDEQA